MLRCREVSRLYASGEIRDAPVRVRLGVWLHLKMCRHCRRYVRELARIGRSVRDLYHAIEDQPDRNEAMVRRALADRSPPAS